MPFNFTLRFSLRLKPLEGSFRLGLLTDVHSGVSALGLLHQVFLAWFPQWVSAERFLFCCPVSAFLFGVKWPASPGGSLGVLSPG